MTSNFICDFCDRHSPMFTVYCREPIISRMGFVTIEHSKEWACCRTCAEFIKKKDLNGLLGFVLQLNDIQDPAYKVELEKHLRELYKSVFYLMIEIKEDGLTSALTEDS